MERQHIIVEIRSNLISTINQLTMRHLLRLFVLFFGLGITVCNLNAQNITFTFAGKCSVSDTAMSIDKVHIVNETNGTDTTIYDTTFTTVVTSIDITELDKNKVINSYPNPFNKEVTISFNSNYNENVQVAAYTVEGKKVSEWNGNVGFGESKFLFKSNVEGLLFLSVNSNNIQLRTKLICMEKSNFSEITSLAYNPNITKSSVILNSGFSFIVGDRLKFTGYSGEVIFEDIVDTPTGNNNYTFVFYVSEGTFVDSRVNITYKWVRIGEQIWMAENLAHLPAVMRPTDGYHFSPRYYVYDYGTDPNIAVRVVSAKETSNYKTYGVLYNWPAAQEACPSGWHIPENYEWEILSRFLGGNFHAGGKMKDTITGYWDDLQPGDTNESGFSGLPGGDRSLSAEGGIFDGIGRVGYWWTANESTGKDETYAVRRELWGIYSYLFYNNVKKGFGYSVRCVKD